MTKFNKCGPSLGSRQVTRVRFYWSYIFTRNFSYWNVRHLTWENVVTLSEQNISQALYIENSLLRIEQLTMLFAAQGVLYLFW